MEMSEEELNLKAKAIMAELGNHVVPLILLPSRNHPPKAIVDSGSAALIDTGERKLLVTCAHVWNSFKEYLEKNPDGVIGIVRGNTGDVVNIARWEAVAISEDKDLAIIDLTDDTIFEGTGKVFFKSSSWPPPEGRVDNAACLLGYPGSEINKDSEDVVVFNLTSVTASISGINDHSITLVDQNNDFRAIEFVTRSDSVEFRFGGMSGGPAFTFVDQRWEFSGIIYAGEVKWNHLILARLAKYISSDGRILMDIVD